MLSQSAGSFFRITAGSFTVNSVDPNGAFVQFKCKMAEKRFPNFGNTWQHLATFLNRNTYLGLTFVMLFSDQAYVFL